MWADYLPFTLSSKTLTVNQQLQAPGLPKKNQGEQSIYKSLKNKVQLQFLHTTK